MFQFKPYPYTDEDIADRLERILATDIPGNDRRQALECILGAIDLTSLEATDTESRISALCEQAMGFSVRKKGAPNVAAVCVYPPFAKQVSNYLAETDIKTACVATAFPSGQTALAVKLMEVSWAVLEGADEVDMVISRGKFLEGKFDEVANEIRAVKAACGEKHLKVILETGELKTVENIRRASEIAILSGADFLKTSTGKIQPAASPEAFLIMLDTIREFHASTGREVGIKAAGGIADAETALRYYLLVKNILGEEWLSKDLFRIGASRLAEKVFSEL